MARLQAAKDIVPHPPRPGSILLAAAQSRRKDPVPTLWDRNILHVARHQTTQTNQLLSECAERNRVSEYAQ